MDAYERHGKDLVAQIAQLQALRDAQRPGSARYERMQLRIDALTDRLEAFDARVPGLRDMDEQIATVQRRLDAVHLDLDPVEAEVGWRDGWRMRTKWPNATAGAVALAVLGVVAGWSWLVVLLLFVAAAGCGVRSWGANNLRRQALDEQAVLDCERASLDHELAVLRERQAALRSGRDPGQEIVAG